MSLEQYHHPVNKISEIIAEHIGLPAHEKIVGYDFLSNVNKYSILSVVNSIYRPESKVWKRYLNHETGKKTKIESESQLNEYVISVVQLEFFNKLIESKKKPSLIIEECFLMIKDIQSEIDKCAKNGTYTNEQSIMITRILLTDFARSVFHDKNLNNAFFNSISFVKFYNFHWNRSEDYINAYNKTSIDNMSTDDLIKTFKNSSSNSDSTREEKNEKSDKIGCLLWVFILTIPYVIYCFIF